ncbi:MAG: LLM class flavin-dependent oxidoreductase [Pseudomonadales bacterium]
MERIGVVFNRGLGPKDIIDCMVLAEELGYESAWMAEGHAGDQFSILSAAALQTSKIALGTAISSVFARSASTIGMAAATVDELSDGRFRLGLGTSHKFQVETEHGLVHEKPITRLKETIKIVEQMMEKGTVENFEGKVYNIPKYELWFEPTRKKIPMYLGAVQPQMLQNAGEFAEGAILTWCSTHYIGSAVENIKIGAERAGRDASEVDISLFLGGGISDDKDPMRNNVREIVAPYVAQFPRYRNIMGQGGYDEALDEVVKAWEAGDQARAKQLVPAEMIDGLALIGNEDEVRARIQTFRDAGVTLPIITPRGSGPGAKEAAIRLIRACAPRS